MQIVIPSWKSIYLDSYICTTCRNFEEHVPENDLKDEKLTGKIRETRKRVI